MFKMVYFHDLTSSSIPFYTFFAFLGPLLGKKGLNLTFYHCKACLALDDYKGREEVKRKKLGKFSFSGTLVGIKGLRLRREKIYFT